METKRLEFDIVTGVEDGEYVVLSFLLLEGVEARIARKDEGKKGVKLLREIGLGLGMNEEKLCQQRDASNGKGTR